MLGASDKMDSAHQHYVCEHHYNILPKLLGSESFENAMAEKVRVIFCNLQAAIADLPSGTPTAKLTVQASELEQLCNVIDPINAEQRKHEREHRPQ
jgi:hypothetical protein